MNAASNARLAGRTLYQVHADGQFVLNVWALDSVLAIARAKQDSGRFGRSWTAEVCSVDYLRGMLPSADFAALGGDPVVRAFVINGRRVAWIALGRGCEPVAVVGGEDWDMNSFMLPCRGLTERLVNEGRSHWSVSGTFAYMLSVHIGWVDEAFVDALERMPINAVLDLGARVRDALKIEREKGDR